MTDILKDYLDILNKYPQNNMLSKMERKSRHNEITQWQKNEYSTSVTANQLNEFLNSYPNLPIVRQFVAKVVVPCVERDMADGNIDGLIILLEQGHDEVFPACRIYNDDWVRVFCNQTNWKYDIKQLTDIVLEKEPRNRFALKYLYCIYKGVIEYSLHELPFGIVSESGTISDMLEILEELTDICEKLELDEEEILANIKRIYFGYKDYIENKEKYTGFDKYLTKHIPDWDK